jgi:hypothetical protein
LKILDYLRCAWGRLRSDIDFSRSVPASIPWGVLPDGNNSLTLMATSPRVAVAE